MPLDDVLPLDLDREYSPSSCIDDITGYLGEYTTRSSAARETQLCHRFRYGPEPLEELDYFPAARPGAPLQVYIHGGYWQELGVGDSSFAAPGFLREGWGFAALGYGLAPVYRLDDIVAMVREGLWWLCRNAARLPGSPGEIHLSGSSAGAHLVAMALLDGWLPEGRHPADVFAGATLLSGVYDLEPLCPTYINDALGLDQAAAARNSPLFLLPDRLPPLTIAIGENETGEFGRQHRCFAEAAKPRAVSVDEFVVPGRNHFDLPFDLGEADTRLGDAVFAHAERHLSLAPRKSIVDKLFEQNPAPKRLPAPADGTSS
ncbi:alpha/beta hydrolase [Amycolatopsis sp. NPDC059021]|uniref:alpha/beta hydrolase n=1 Tax=Amycolatopsis sp. NPDC059021 TaxID=3346704 RepID=UPI003670E2F4